jgi:hypothetical protein
MPSGQSVAWYPLLAGQMAREMNETKWGNASTACSACCERKRERERISLQSIARTLVGEVPEVAQPIHASMAANSSAHGVTPCNTHSNMTN